MTEKHNIDKYKKYLDKYNDQSNKIFWGLGIENELYLEFDNRNTVNRNDFIKYKKRERYSVDYYSNYKSEFIDDAINHYLKEDTILVPILFNSNSFTKTDMYNNSKTRYTKLCEPNLKFSGETLIETLCNINPYFKESMNNKWLFDGDTIEFNTLNFYNAKLQNIVNELENAKNEFIENINKSFKQLAIFTKFGNLKIMEKNHPFANHMTNLQNNTMFNNGTLHYNITLPTLLDQNGQISDFKSFTNIHSRAIKIIQWMEPFIVAICNSPDPFSLLDDYQDKLKYSKASQRCAISRYISIGTYDSDIMKKGKVLTCKTDELICNEFDYWWFNNYYNQNNYNKLESIGMDINFNKYSNHGIELRFLDHITDKNKLFDSFEFIIYLMDHILDCNDDINNPIINKTWNNFVLNIMIYGSDYQLNLDEKMIYEKLFKLKLSSYKLKEVYNEIYLILIQRYSQIDLTNENNIYTLIPHGKFSKLTLNLYNKEIHFPFDLLSTESTSNFNCCLFYKKNKKNKKKNKKRI